MSTRRLDAIWLVLLAATALTWWLGERGATGTVTMLILIGTAGIKGGLVVLDFMALRRVRYFWPATLLLWLSIVLGVIAWTYLASQS